MLTSSWSVEFDHKLVESAEDGDLVLALDADGWLKENGRHQEQTLHTSLGSPHTQTGHARQAEGLLPPEKPPSNGIWGLKYHQGGVSGSILHHPFVHVAKA